MTPKISEYNPPKNSVEINKVAKNNIVKNTNILIVILINRNNPIINIAKYIMCSWLATRTLI